MALIVALIVIAAIIILLSIRKHVFYSNAAAYVKGIRLAVTNDGYLTQRGTFLPHRRVGKVTGVHLSKAGAMSTILSFTFSDRVPYTYNVRGGQLQGVALHDQVKHYLAQR